jgi:hypothetical protein
MKSALSTYFAPLPPAAAPAGIAITGAPSPIF